MLKLKKNGGAASLKLKKKVARTGLAKTKKCPRGYADTSKSSSRRYWSVLKLAGPKGSVILAIGRRIGLSLLWP